MRRIVLSVVAVFLPWLVLLLEDNPGGAVVALVMQATLIGWPFASMWAWRTIYPAKPVQETPKQKTGKEQ